MIEKQYNPFLDTLYIPYIEYVKRVRGTGEAAVPDSFKVESTPHFRVYKDPILLTRLYKELTMWARDLFTLLQYFTHDKYRYIIITYDKVKEMYGEYSPRRYHDTIKELVVKGVIDLKDREKNQYWYNPKYFSPTSRVKLFEEHSHREKIINI